jgi:hypothetical protein
MTFIYQDNLGQSMKNWNFRPTTVCSLVRIGINTLLEEINGLVSDASSETDSGCERSLEAEQKTYL